MLALLHPPTALAFMFPLWNGKSVPSHYPLIRQALLTVRDFQVNDYENVYRLLLDETLFPDMDPEGPLTDDCGSAALVLKSYDIFMVAEKEDAKGRASMVGCGGVVVGTSIAYMESGGSVSSEKVTGALRRIVGADSEVVKSILSKLEDRVQVDELIVLAYDNEPSTRPNSLVLESMHYEPRPMKGLKQYQKTMEQENSQSLVSNAPSGGTDVSVPIGPAILVGGVLALCLYGVSQFLGLEWEADTTNGGFGSPLSVQELERLQLDEQLERTSLEEGEWNDLTDEQRQEEAALMKVIQGKEIRYK